MPVTTTDKVDSDWEKFMQWHINSMCISHSSEPKTELQQNIFVGCFIQKKEVIFSWMQQVQCLVCDSDSVPEN